MKVLMIKSHPYGGRLVVGKEIEASVKAAQELIKGGYAEEIKPKKAATTKVKK